jgi:protein gp37
MTFSHRIGFDLWGKDKPRRFFGDRPYNDLIRWNRTALKEFGRPARVFLNSMSDLFEDRRDLDEHRTRLWNLVPDLPNLELLLLTKRIEAVHRLVPKHWMDLGFPSNVRIGTTVENQAWYERRVPTLSRLPAKNFLSIEPLLGPIDATAGNSIHATGDPAHPTRAEIARIDWAIVGSESGAKRRETKLEWVERLASHLSHAGTAFFVKQLELGGKVEKDIAHFPRHLRIQEFP